MYILGVSCFYHDAAAALLKDGELVAAAEEERFSRLKHDFGFPNRAIDFCLKKGGISPQDLDYVVFYEKPFVKFERILMSIFQTFPKSWKVFRESTLSWILDKLWIEALLKEKLSVSKERILFSDHHMSHAASAFLASPFEEAAIITVDGVGEWTTTTVGIGKDTEIKLLKEVRFPHSLGLLYSTFTAFLGFQVNEGEYKVMGMAPYGKPNYLDKVHKLVQIEADSSFCLDMDYFCYHHSTDKMYNSKFEALFGEPRPPEMHFFTAQSEYPSYFGSKPSNYTELCRLNRHYADIAASVQTVTEEILLKIANSLYEETKLKRLCLAGGVALNSVANGKILQQTPFEEVYVQPAAGDSGGALGAALYVYHTILGNPRKFVMDHAYYGQEYTEDEVKKFLDDSAIPYEYISDEQRLLDLVVGHLIKGKVIGWYQGRFEWGPRALGNRSILADPRQAEMKDIVNTKIKFREPYRPFAPSVLAEWCETFFELPKAQKHYPARFMLLVVPVKEEKREQIPAVTHVDGSGRLQTVFKETSPRYYQLIERFGQATGIPVLLNTSFNLRGEPIVTSPEDAFRTFIKSEMDLLVLERFVVKKI